MALFRRQIMAVQWQIADPFAGSSVNRVAECRSKRWNGRFSDSRRSSIGLQEFHVDVQRSIRHLCHSIGVKVVLIGNLLINKLLDNGLAMDLDDN